MIISVNDITNKTLSRDLNYIVDAVIWPKFGNSPKKFDQKNHFFWGVGLVQVQLFGTDTKYELEILHQCGKRVKTKSQKVLEANSYICKSYRGKAGRGEGGGLFALALPPTISYTE